MESRGKTTTQFLRAGLIVLITMLLPACGSHTYHQVRKNDTLYSISWHYHQDYRQVAAWNSLTPPYVIQEGQWLRVAPPGPGDIARAPNDKNITKPATATPPASGRVPGGPRVTSAAPVNTAAAAVSGWQWPVRGEIIQKFESGKIGKQGIDIAGRAGTPVHAAAPGRVVYSGNGLRGYGNLVIIKHNEKFLSAYAHNQSLEVKEGDDVQQGQMIARMGSAESTQVKLHFQIRIDGRPVDPLRYLPK